MSCAEDECECSFCNAYANDPFLIFYGNRLFLAAGPANPQCHRGIPQAENLRRGILRPITGAGLDGPRWAFAITCVKHAHLGADAVGVGWWAIKNDSKAPFCAPINVQLRGRVVL